MSRINTLLKKKNISIITCYDATFSNLLEQCKCDAVLVGDSLGIIIKGEKNTRKVSMDEMIYHTQAVRRGSTSLPIISDMPLLALETKKNTLINAKALIDAGADMIKIEGGSSKLPLIKFLSDNKLSSAVFEVELYKRLVKALSLTAMILMAMLFIFGPTRDVSLGRKIFFGVALGLTFELTSRIGGAIALSFDFSPLISSILPAILVIFISITLLVKKSRS